ncbi:hypothetical protein NL676_027914 [Syzygium grande]|nr:hypothetical protein NL676_027914 [Syzygium grande]
MAYCLNQRSVFSYRALPPTRHSLERGGYLSRRGEDGGAAFAGATPAEGKATVCLQCGDRGFDVALIYCEDCESYAIHHYCLETLPKTFDEDVDWFCDDCQSKSGKPDTNKESCSPLCEVDDLPDLKIPESVQCTKNSKEYIHLERLGKKKNKKRKRQRKKKKREKNELKPQREKDEEGEQLGDKGTERLGKKKNKKKRKKNKLKDQREKYEEGGQLGEKGTVFTSGAEVEKTKDIPLIQVYETRCSGNYDEAGKKGGQLGEKGTVFTSGAEVEKTEDIPLSQVCETRCSRNYDKAGNIGLGLRAISADTRNSYGEAVSMKAPQLPKRDFPKLFGKDTYVHAQPIIDSIRSSLFTGSGYTTYTKLFVGGLALETKSDTLMRYFEQFGNILEAFTVTDKNTSRSKGYGYVTLHNHESARRACENPRPVIDGRRAYCNFASLGRPRPPLPYGQLRPVTPLIVTISYDYQPGYVYPPYEYPTYEPNYVYPQNCRVPIILTWPSITDKDAGSANNAPLGGPNITGGTPAAVPTIQVPCTTGN